MFKNMERKIDYQNIKKECFDFYRQVAFGTVNNDFTSYDLLLMIMENIDRVADFDNDPDNRMKAINYYKSAIKCEIFSKLSDFEHFNYATINSLKDDSEDKKMLFVPSNEPICPYFSMGLIKTADKYDVQETNPYYAVNTLLAMSDPKKFFDGKEVIIPTQMLISDNKNLKKISATADEKIRLLTMYKSIVEKYKVNSSINIYGDYEALLNDISNKLTLK